MLAGLVLLNLCAISLDVTAGEVSISNQEVLDQLVDLRNFIDEKRDFTKQSAKGLKPVAVQYRSSASKVDGIVYCNLSFNTDALHLSIAGYSVQADGTPLSLIINVVYEWTEYVGYTIKSAKINATKTFAVDGDLDVTGDISGDSFDGDTQLEKIKDANGHNRFIEGDITLVEGLTGFTQTYGKWALSGSHLLIVVAFDIADATDFIGARICNINVPKWVYDKIYALYGGANAVVANIVASGYADDYSSQTASVYINKPSEQPLSIYLNAITTTKERHFRIAFDLLIDNE